MAATIVSYERFLEIRERLRQATAQPVHPVETVDATQDSRGGDEGGLPSDVETARAAEAKPVPFA
jgi:hypothetical protein